MKRLDTFRKEINLEKHTSALTLRRQTVVNALIGCNNHLFITNINNEETEASTLELL